MYEIKYRDENEMVDSGIAWYSQIPQNWRLSKVKRLFKVSRGRVIAKTELNDEYLFPVYSSQTKNDGLLGYIKTYDFDTTQLTWTTDGANAGTVFIRKGKHNCTNVCGTLQPFTVDNNIMFLKYILEYTAIYHKRADINGYKIMSNEMEEIEIALPELRMQQKIANFLDIKTTQFDNIIAKKEQLINKLEEAKKSMISEMVTGKMKIVDGQLIPRDASEMKESGVDWLGLVPKEWNVKRIKNLFNLRNERNSKKMDEVQILTLYTSIGVRKQEDVESRTGNKVRTVQDYKIVHPDDIVVNIILAWMGAIGYSNDKGVISPAYDIYQPLSDVNSRFYNYLFRTTKFSGECFKYGRGIMLMRWRTYSDEFRSIHVCHPSKNEQDLISNYVDTKTHDIEIVVKQNNEQITMLKQAKQALISEAVTGKIDLRDWEIIEEGELQ